MVKAKPLESMAKLGNFRGFLFINAKLLCASIIVVKLQAMVLNFSSQSEDKNTGNFIASLTLPKVKEKPLTWGQC